MGLIDWAVAVGSFFGGATQVWLMWHIWTACREREERW